LALVRDEGATELAFFGDGSAPDGRRLAGVTAAEATGSGPRPRARAQVRSQA